MPTGFAIVLDGVGGMREAIDLDEPWPSVPEPSVIVLNYLEPRALAWFAALVVEVLRFWSESYLSEVLDHDKLVANLEARSFERDVHGEVEALHELRRVSTLLRRRVTSLRAATVSLAALSGTDLVDANRGRWRELARETEETVDLLDGVMDRLHGIDDFVQNNLATPLGDRLYVLTLISAIILPLSFITGLLGVNVGGIPLHDSRWAFPLLCALLIGIAVTQYGIARRMHWLPRQDPGVRRRRGRLRRRAA